MPGEFTEAGGALIESLVAALQTGAAEIMQEADFLVPKDTETLRESARIFPPDTNVAGKVGIDFGFGFGGAINPKTGNAVETYTVPVHEILDVYHEPPTQAKFLEQPLFAYAGVAEGQLDAEIRIQWGKQTPGTFRPVPSGRMMYFKLFGGGYAVRGAFGRFERFE